MSLERKFFKIANAFMMAVATLAILSAIIAGVYGLMLRHSSVNTTISQPTVSYDELKAAKAEMKAKNQAKATASATPTPTLNDKIIDEDAIPPEFLPILNEIEMSISSFAKKTGQPPVKDKLRSNIYHAAKEYEAIVPIDKTLAALKTETKKLEEDADRISQMQKVDEEYIEWPDFLSFFFGAYQKNINKQVHNIEAAKAAAEQDKIQSYFVLVGAGCAFGSFIFTTLILLLFSIDKNIYAIKSAHCKNEQEQGEVA
ncbi:hypothetical protein [Nitratidesulfovibrio liaohensis]|uniref:Four helix bundle sensory module for signal transduction n=1 Tax=Nitratidesulfovibrio liaohensis TaxID=2604158 RepID=A0ABY9R2T0_9BACT|nr:hypothetical protein [Nitratidesulfovibrio liaohensis]WMW65749.1 hypothetical protein KPS_000258 [Nitratidesulfovibrio liaohensis]